MGLYPASEKAIIEVKLDDLKYLIVAQSFNIVVIQGDITIFRNRSLVCKLSSRFYGPNT